ncbi:MAG: GAF domain-containing protein [Holdemania massiliensis]
MKENELILGPFQGKPACTHIALGKGVCGTAALQGECLVVPDVHQFPGHIACDGASRSEIVVPIRLHGQVVAVLDLDAPIPNRFGLQEETILRELGAWLSSLFDWIKKMRLGFSACQ